MESNYWVKSFAIVTFDEDIGQRVESQHPVYLNDCYQQILAYLAFPDSNSFNKEGSLIYTFRLKYEPELFGFVYFRQIKDLLKPRKYSQKSIVLLTEHPYTSLFKQTISIVGSLFFDHGESIFEAVNNCFRAWGEPVPGRSLELPMMGTVLNFMVPSVDSAFSPQLLGDGLGDILDSLTLGHPGLYQDINLCEIFGMAFCQKYLWSFWEIFITGEDLLFVTDSPETCSFGVLGLASLISPLVYLGEIFPYFTIFDSEYRAVQNNYERKKLSETVISGTNPYILKVFKDMTHIFQFEDKGGLTACFQKSQSGGRYEGLMLLEGGSKELNLINNTAIRRYFRDLTLMFLHPFQEYLTLDQNKLRDYPLSEHISLKSFTEQEFLSSIKSKSQIPLTRFLSKQKSLQLYSKFIKTRTFNTWFAAQRQKASQESSNQLRQAIKNFDISKLFTLDKRERRVYYEKIKRRIDFEEIVADDLDALMKLRHQLSVLGQNIAKVNETI